MVVPVAIAAGKKAAPVAKAAARKASDNPGAVLLIGGIALLLLAKGIKSIPKIPDLSAPFDVARAPFDWVGDEFDTLFNPPSGQFSPSDPLAELRQEVMGIKRKYRTTTSFLGGIVEGEDMDDPGPEYYQKVHYDASGVPVAVPVEINRTARKAGEAIRKFFNR